MYFAPALMIGEVLSRSFRSARDGAGVVAAVSRRLRGALCTGTKSFVLLCDDPDAPAGTWHHWAAYDLPAVLNELAEGAARNKNVKQAVNDFRKVGYGGPCPPHDHGPHHYHFRLLALSTDQLQAKANASCRDIEREARKSLIAEATLVGWYER
jgi:Raf kinase inhibitor-like YbhB/YbcL family protein